MAKTSRRCDSAAARSVVSVELAIAAKLTEWPGGICNGTQRGMAINLRSVAVAGGLLTAMAAAEPALAQKPGGILRLSHFDSPASMSILEESTRAAEQPMMHVFNNLVMYK